MLSALFCHCSDFVSLSTATTSDRSLSSASALLDWNSFVRYCHSMDR